MYLFKFYKPFLLIVSINFLLPFQAFAYNYGDPSAAEQVHLENINRARANPVAEAQRICQERAGSNICAGVTEDTNPQVTTNALPPLTFNTLLHDSAKKHSQDMYDRDFFAHNNPDGKSPFDRIKATGYQYRTAGENIAYAMNSETNEAKMSAELHDNLFEDKNVSGRGHRVNILSPDFKEVGVGFISGKKLYQGYNLNAWYVTVNFGTSASSQSFITGVAYDDKNGNGVYDAGEGLADVQITTQNGEKTTTATAGGYGLPLNNGTYTLTIQHATLGSTTREVNVNGQNVKLDIKASDFSATITPPDTGTIPEPTTPPTTTIDRLEGISTNAFVSADKPMIAGIFVTGGEKSVRFIASSIDKILIPRLTVRTHPNGDLVFSDNNSANSASIEKTISLSEGYYTITVEPVGQSGQGMIEVYESGMTNAKLGGISTNAFVSDSNPMIAGVSIKGGKKNLYIRASSIDNILIPLLEIRTHPDATLVYQETNSSNQLAVDKTIELNEGLYTMTIKPQGVSGKSMIEVYER